MFHYHNGVELETADQRKELAEFKKELLESIKSKKKEELFTMDNSDKKVENFIDYAYSHKDEIILCLTAKAEESTLQRYKNSAKAQDCCRIEVT